MKVVLLSILFLTANAWGPGLAAGPKRVKRIKWKTIGKPQKAQKTVWKVKGSKTFYFVAGMSIDADGSPKTYHPKNKGLDHNANGKYKGRWVSVVMVNGKPYVQKAGDPAPGYYVSTTSLRDPSKKRTDPRSYVNAQTIPYIALPKSLLGTKGKKTDRAQLGDLAVVYNRKNGRVAYALIADQGPSYHLGEGSIALAKSLEIPSGPKSGGQTNDVVYLVFPNSGQGIPKTKKEINRTGKKLLKKWGGIKRLKRCR